MSQTYKLAQKILSNPLLTPVDGYAQKFNPDNDECEISFEFGGLKGIMEEMEREDPIQTIHYDDEEISTKSCSPLGQFYLQEEKLKLKSIFLQQPLEEFDLETINKKQNAFVKPKNSEISIFSLNQNNDFNFFNCNVSSQPVRRKKIKISQVLKKKWKTKLPSFVENQRSKLISKINLINNQNINKYKNENELKMSMMNLEERHMEEKIPDRRMSHPNQRNKEGVMDFSRKPSKSFYLKNHSNKFNQSENSEINSLIYLKNRNSFYENKPIDYTNGSNLQIQNLPVNKFNSINLDYFPFETNSKNFYNFKSQNL